MLRGGKSMLPKFFTTLDLVFTSDFKEKPGICPHFFVKNFSSTLSKPIYTPGVRCKERQNPTFLGAMLPKYFKGLEFFQ